VAGIALGAACVAGVGFGVSAVLIVALVCLALRVAGKIGATASLVMVSVAIAGALRAAPAPDTSSPDWVDNASALRGVVVSGPMSNERGQRFNMRVSWVRDGTYWRTTDATVCVSAAARPVLRRGDQVYLAVTGERLEDLPAGVGNALSARGCSASVTAWSATLRTQGHGWRHTIDGVRRSMADRLQAAAPGDSGALLAGLVTGDDGALSDGARDAFITTGTTHITAVSGSNIAIVVVFAVTVGGWFGAHRRVPWQALTVGGVWLYALLVGLEPPALRAAIVATGAVFAATFGRRADLVTLTILAAAVQLLVRPTDVWTLSFRLSFVSALALALVLHGLSASGATGAMRTALVATTAAQIATAPVLLSSFHRISAVGLPANLLIAPLVGIAFPIAFIASLAGLVSEPLGEAIAAPGALAAGGILNVVETTSRIDGAQFTIGDSGAIGSIVVAGTCVAVVAAMSHDCRHALRRWWRSLRAAPAIVVALGALGGLGFAIGLIAAAAR
jgi:competence protein ComEC